MTKENYDQDKQMFDGLTEAAQKTVINRIRAFYDEAQEWRRSAFETGAALHKLETEYHDDPQMEGLAIWHFRRMLEGKTFLTEKCGYSAAEVPNMRLTYNAQFMFLKFYLMYRRWPELARKIPPKLKRVRLAVSNCRLQLPQVRDSGRPPAESDFYIHPETILRDVGQLVGGKSQRTIASIEAAIAHAAGRLADPLEFIDETSLQKHLEENWATIFGVRGIDYLAREVRPGLTKDLDFLGLGNPILYAIEVKTAASKPAFIGDLLANMVELRKARGYQKGYRNTRRNVADPKYRVTAKFDSVVGIVVAPSFSWQLVFAANHQPIILVKLDRNLQVVQWIDMSKPPSDVELENLVGNQFPYRGMATQPCLLGQEQTLY